MCITLRRAPPLVRRIWLLFPYPTAEFEILEVCQLIYYDWSLTLAVSISSRSQEPKQKYKTKSRSFRKKLRAGVARDESAIFLPPPSESNSLV